MKSTLLLIIVALSLLSCNQKKNITTYNFPVILDTTFGVPTEKDTYFMQISNYRHLYIGPKLDTITLPYPHEYLHKYSFTDNHGGYFNRPDSSGINIFINSAETISDIAFRWKDKNGNTSKQLYKAHPVIITNTRKDTLEIGVGDYIPLFTEALDPEGNWRPIEIVFGYRCDYGIPRIILPPNEIMLTATPVYKGNFKTKLRLRFNNILSDEYDGYIYLRQFENFYEM